MSKEIKSMEDALFLRLGKMVMENVELEQRIDQLMDEYNEVVRQLRGREKRNDEDPARPTLGQIAKMSYHCDELKVENNQLKKYVKSVDSFIKDKELYMSKGIKCPYIQGHLYVCSTSCLECNYCLRVLDDCGVVCGQVLNGAKVEHIKPCPPHQGNS